jgi:hypothetical protein
VSISWDVGVAWMWPFFVTSGASIVLTMLGMYWAIPPVYVAGFAGLGVLHNRLPLVRS